MDKGKIIEQGTHKELLEKKGQYYRLWEMQQENFVIREDEIKEKQREYTEESDDKGEKSYPRIKKINEKRRYTISKRRQ